MTARARHRVAASRRVGRVAANRRVRHRVAASGILFATVGLLAGSCDYNRGDRWFASEPIVPPEPVCELDERRCGDNLERCTADADGTAFWEVIEDCVSQDKVCAPTLLACAHCLPETAFCDGLDARLCDGKGETSEFLKSCDAEVGEACRSGGCLHLCTQAGEEKSNVGCEYWAVDLDNAMIDITRNASAQQYAVVVSNPQPDVPVHVEIFQDDGAVGDEPAPYLIADAVIAPLNLRVFKLGPREVDGSPEGTYNTGSHSAWSRKAFKISSDFPVVAYQFNPLENVNVFSNDASLLKSREALTYATDGVTLSYVVAGWPQTIAITDDPNTNFSAAFPINLRSFLTIVGTQEDTTVVVRPTTRVVGGDGIPDTNPGVGMTFNIAAFDVLNLESPDTNSFGADFTGTTIESNRPIAVFVGSEAADAPSFDNLFERRCCADHLEEQLDPVRTAGKTFALAHSPNRTVAVRAAGSDIGEAPEPEYFRFVATSSKVTTVTTTLPPPNDSFQLNAIGDWREITSLHDFQANSSEPIHVVQLMASQDAANVPRGLPGGDPSLLVVPPREQYRPDYVFLTPDKYVFDFVTIVAPTNAVVRLDEQPVDAQLCGVRASDGLTEEQRGGPPELVTYACQLSFPIIDPDDGEISPGTQNDGVHRISASAPVGVTVAGFDRYVSYAYAAGTELREIAIPE